MSPFNHSDFLANPRKYELYSSACVSANVFTHDGDQDLQQGEPVGVKYLRTAYNGMRRRYEPIYTVTVSKQGQRETWGCLFANALGDFVL